MSRRDVYVSYAAAAEAAIAAAALPLVESMAILTADAVKDVIRESRPSGRLYRIPGTRSGRDRPASAMRRRRGRGDPYGPLPASNMYQASAPGEAPAERLSLYLASWTNTPAVQVGTEVVAAAYSDRMTPDGKHLLGAVLEFGTRRRSLAASLRGGLRRYRTSSRAGGGMAPRPHVSVAMRRVGPKIQSLIRAANAGS